MPEAVDAGIFKAGMKRLLCGVTLITASLDGRPAGLVSTNVCSPGMLPPSMLIAVNHNASCHAAIAEGGAFCINFLGADQQRLFKRFASPDQRDFRFSDPDWEPGWRDLPIFVESLASLQCAVSDRIARPASTIFIGTVVDVRLNAKASGEPLAWFDGMLRG